MPSVRTDTWLVSSDGQWRACASALETGHDVYKGAKLTALCVCHGVLVMHSIFVKSPAALTQEGKQRQLGTHQGAAVRQAAEEIGHGGRGSQQHIRTDTRDTQGPPQGGWIGKSLV